MPASGPIPTPPAPQLRAYRASRYEAAGMVARIGRPAPPLAAWMRRHRARCAGFVTAENPFSAWRPPGWNARAMRRFDAATRRWPRLAGHGGTPRWREAHRLLAAPLPALHALARRFRQRALVILRPGRPARLDILGITGYKSYGRPGDLSQTMRPRATP